MNDDFDNSYDDKMILKKLTEPPKIDCWLCQGTGKLVSQIIAMACPNCGAQAMRFIDEETVACDFCHRRTDPFEAQKAAENADDHA